MKPFVWFGLITIYTLLTLLFVYTIPPESAFSVFTYAFGFVFVSFVPGYCLVHLIFGAKENKLNLPEEAVLSVALSFSIVGLSGLFLGISPIGISLNSVRLTLSPIVVIIAFAAFLRKRKLRKPELQSSKKIGSRSLHR